MLDAILSTLDILIRSMLFQKQQNHIHHQMSYEFAAVGLSDSEAMSSRTL